MAKYFVCYVVEVEAEEPDMAAAMAMAGLAGPQKRTFVVGRDPEVWAEKIGQALKLTGGQAVTLQPVPFDIPPELAPTAGNA